MNNPREYSVGQNTVTHISWRKEMRKQITILKILTTLTAIALLIQVVELFV
jgi:hypothetical protein